MASAGASFATVVAGFIIAALLFNSINVPTETTEEITFSGGSYEFTTTLDVDSYSTLYIRFGGDEGSDYAYGDPFTLSEANSTSSSLVSFECTSPGNGVFSAANLDSLAHPVYFDIVITIVDYNQITMSFTNTDGEDHLVFIGLTPDASSKSDLDYYEFSSTLYVDGSSTTVTLLLNDNTFMAALVGCLVFVLFLVAALMLYAGGVRR